MRLVTFYEDHLAEPAVLVDDQAIRLRGAGFHTLQEVVAGGAESIDRIQRWIYSPPNSAFRSLSGLRYLPPIPRPHKIICIGLNYRDHAEESKLAIPEVPTVFSKFSTAAIGHGQPIILPKNSAKPDYEAEFAVVIGKGGRHIAEENWAEHVFGYTMLNDVSARDFQMATSQWMMGKTFDTFAPFGPAIVTADEVPDPHNLSISLTLNGEVMQNSNTGNMIFRIPRIIAHLSSVFTLEPGDIIATGTPAGVGFARKPPVWLKEGDQVTVAVEGLGALTNPVLLEK